MGLTGGQPAQHVPILPCRPLTPVRLGHASGTRTPAPTKAPDEHRRPEGDVRAQPDPPADQHDDGDQARRRGTPPAAPTTAWPTPSHPSSSADQAGELDVAEAQRARRDERHHEVQRRTSPPCRPAPARSARPVAQAGGRDDDQRRAAPGRTGSTSPSGSRCTSASIQTRPTASQAKQQVCRQRRPAGEVADPPAQRPPRAGERDRRPPPVPGRRRRPRRTRCR